MIFAIEDYENQKINETIRLLDRRDDVIIKITPDMRDIVYGSVKMNSIFHSPLITINTRPMEEWQYSLKRLCDIVFSLLALIILSPLFLVTAILVKCSSPGPIFYAQERIGYRGKPFKMHKFRSMYVDAESAGPALSSDDDPRITPWGRVMRKFRLDEIPQFFNILKGDMSIVGNRPLPLYEAEKLTIDSSIDRFVAPAGLTGLWQVEERGKGGKMSAEERKQLDILYAQTYNFGMDMKILFRTLVAFVQKENV